MVGSAAGLQLADPQKEHGHPELADIMQPPILVAYGGQPYIADTIDQTHVRELAMGIGR